ncbi:MAG: hypothetical protein M3430_00840 [Acidobacteriota bacterium]|nr:hypothetical protein [Acidobacteriota bacterium]
MTDKAKEWLRDYGFVFAVYALVTLLTDAHYMGDTGDYADSIDAFVSKVNYKFWEFGHLLWRPFGWLIYALFQPAVRLFTGETDVHRNVIFTLMALNWLAGLACALLLRAFVRRVCERDWIANLAAVCFIFTHGFLNYTQTGCSYVPGLAFLLLSFYVLARDGDKPDSTLRTSVVAGIALAGALLFWFLYLWAIPALLAVPLLLFGNGRRQWRLAIQTAVVFTLVTGVVYALALLHLRIFTIAELKAWISPAGAPEIKGFSRMLFGFARSFIQMGNDGMLLKRFMLRDPYSPVSLAEILSLSLWKFAFFYLFLAAVVINLLRSPKGRRVLALFLVGAIPVIGFAIIFLGGDLERYMALYPLLFLALALSLDSPRALPQLKVLTLAFVAALIVSNSWAMAKVVLNREEETAAARVRDLRPLLKPNSRLFTVNLHDDLLSFNRDFPLHPVNRDANLRPWAVVTPNAPWGARWREDFAKQVRATWDAGGEAWISRRAFSERPKPDWNWVEGDDPRVSWSDIYNFFAPFELGQTAGGEDGFSLLERSPRNEQIVQSLLSEMSPPQH